MVFTFHILRSIYHKIDGNVGKKFLPIIVRNYILD